MFSTLHIFFVFFFFKQKTAYEMRISDWSSDVCSSDLGRCGGNIWCNRGCERAGVKQFIEHRGIAAPLRLTNVDTDKILPGRFLKTITREGLGQHLFHSMRYAAKIGRAHV